MSASVRRKRLTRAYRSTAAVMGLAALLISAPLPSSTAAFLRALEPSTLQSPFVLGSVAFPSARVGFVTVEDTETGRGSLYRTVDGGRSWIDSLSFPAGGLGPAGGLLSTDLTFISSRVGFLYTASGSWSGVKPRFRGILERTVDGGRTWMRVSMPREPWQGYASFSFLNRSDGWVLLSSWTTMGQSSMAEFHTVNRGRSWKLQALATYGKTGQIHRGGLSMGAADERIHFASPSNGWILAYDAAGGWADDLVTVSDGARWLNCKDLPTQIVPRARCQAPIAPAALYRQAASRRGSGQVFTTQLDSGDFFRKQALLPVMAVPYVPNGVKHPKPGGFFMYRLDRHSNVWKVQSRLRLGMRASLEGDVADDVATPRDWFFATTWHVSYTLNAGHSWSRLTSPLPKTFDIGGVRFFGSKTGYIWGGSVNQNGPFSYRSTLYRTQDAGRTWTVIRLPIS